MIAVIISLLRTAGFSFCFLVLGLVFHRWIMLSRVFRRRGCITKEWRNWWMLGGYFERWMFRISSSICSAAFINMGVLQKFFSWNKTHHNTALNCKLQGTWSSTMSTLLHIFYFLSSWRQLADEAALRNLKRYRKAPCEHSTSTLPPRQTFASPWVPELILMARKKPVASFSPRKNSFHLLVSLVMKQISSF